MQRLRTYGLWKVPTGADTISFKWGPQELGNGLFPSHYVVVPTHAKRSFFFMGNKNILICRRLGLRNAKRKMASRLNLISTIPDSIG
jgi:hypothetical protein